MIDFRRDDDVVPASVLLERPSDDLFPFAVRVDVTGVEKIEAFVERPVQNPGGLRRRRRVRKVIGAQANRRDANAGAS